ncbi:G3P acyltransferase [Chlamydia abortus]|nr:G3P acyltransferase [Chlamydia abortus]
MGKDIRQIGSNNAGTTNALRNFGLSFGLQVFIFDLLKSFIPCLFLVLLQRYMIKTSTNFSYVIPLVAGIGIVIGHIFPIFFKFKGGKGVVCFFGIVLTFHIVLFILLFIFYIIILLMFRYISLASVLSSIIISLLSYIPFYYDHNILISFANQNVY